MSHRILKSLPDRPLLYREFEGLLEELPQSIQIFPGSVLTTPNGPVVPIIHVVLKESEEVRYYGYAENQNGWELIGSWLREAYDQEEIESTIQSWGVEQFGEEFVEHGSVEVGGTR